MEQKFWEDAQKHKDNTQDALQYYHLMCHTEAEDVMLTKRVDR